MRVTKHHHACVYVEDEQTRVLVDPGQLGPRPSLDGVDAILITHGHFDHFDPALAVDAVRAGVHVWGPADVVEELRGAEGTYEAVAGSSFSVGSLTVQVAGNRHAEVHPHRAGPPNRAYSTGGVFITGDEHPVPPEPVTALITPIDAPWLRHADLIRYVRAIRPSQVIGVHDGLLNAAGIDVAHHCAEVLLNEGVVQAHVLRDGETLTIASAPG